MKISHVIRGEDHISNTPKQILIYSALGWEIPEFAHLPMILGSDGKRLSKRHGATGTQTYKELGYQPEALINYLSLLGWNPGTDDEIFDIKYLIKNFSLDNVNKKAAVFDSKKLEWISSQHIITKNPKELLNLIMSIQPEWGAADATDEYLEMVVDNLKARSKSILDIINQSGYFFNDPIEYDQGAIEKCWGEEASHILKSYYEDILKTLNWDHKLIDESMTKFVESKSIGKGKLIQPLRVALTGALTGPSMVDLMVLLKKDTCLRRIKNSLKSIQI